MKVSRTLVSWAVTVGIVAIVAVVCYKFTPSKANQEAMRNARAPAKMVLDQPRLRKAMGPSVMETVRTMEGPDYDVSKAMEVEW